MTTAQIVILIFVIVAAVAGAIFLLMRKRSQKLQNRFGPEYDRVIRESGNRLKAEAELEKLEKRVDSYAIHPLSPTDRDRFQQRWRTIQTNFVDNPEAAFLEADKLLTEVMARRGYPMANFEQRAAELAVDHGVVVSQYRTAHEIAMRQSQKIATTEELRQGMIHYRALFEDLTDTGALRARAASRN